MNIFVLDMDPAKAARYHCDKHVVKMCLEYAQLLCTAAHEYAELDKTDLYRPTHLNHPCTRWTRECVGNVMWLRGLLKNLGDEYKLRYGKEHASVRVGLVAARRLMKCAPNMPRTHFVLAMPEQYHKKSPIAAYRAYYIAEKAAIATWKTEPPPWWPKEV